MGWRWKQNIVAAVTLAVLTLPGVAQAQSTHMVHKALVHSAAHGYGQHRAHVGFAYGRHGLGHRRHFADLVGDPYSGLGFYQLPLRYRVGAYSYHLRTAQPPWRNPIRAAVAADAARYNYWIPSEATSYRYGVFDPNEGVGTPFFAGYYSADDHDDGPMFGRPLAD